MTNIFSSSWLNCVHANCVIYVAEMPTEAGIWCIWIFQVLPIKNSSKRSTNLRVRTIVSAFSQKVLLTAPPAMALCITKAWKQRATYVQHSNLTLLSYKWNKKVKRLKAQGNFHFNQAEGTNLKIVMKQKYNNIHICISQIATMPMIIWGWQNKWSPKDKIAIINIILPWSI